jgi:hypothetical protein
MLSVFASALSNNISLAQINSATDAKTHNGISFLSVFRVITIGANKAVQPTIINVLNMLLPTTLPIDISALPFKAEETLTVSSGVEVPKATIVSPITIEGMLNRLAIDEAPSVNPLAPNKMSTSPPIRSSMFIVSLFCVQI